MSKLQVRASLGWQAEACPTLLWGLKRLFWSMIHSLHAAPRDVPDEPPPFLGTWRRVYTAILIYLVVIIAGFYLFTRAYR